MDPSNIRQWFARLLTSKPTSSRPSQFHAIAIKCMNDACQAAIDSQGQRQLSREAPLLPLARCDRPERCQCRYQHYEDRRTESRRGGDEGIPEHHDKTREERRQVKGRRDEDLAKDPEPFSFHDDSYFQHVDETNRMLSLKRPTQGGVDPYNSGSFDNAKDWKATSSE